VSYLFIYPPAWGVEAMCQLGFHYEAGRQEEKVPDKSPARGKNARQKSSALLIHQIVQRLSSLYEYYVVMFIFGEQLIQFGRIDSSCELSSLT